MDEFGSRIQHSDTPNVRLVPFCYVPTQTAFTVMWPISDIEDGGLQSLCSSEMVMLMLVLQWSVELRLPG